MLQSIQNVAARLITGARWCDHITPVMQQLHWLSVRGRVDYKVTCLVHQSLSGHAPRYRADDINFVANSGRRLLRSAYDRTHAVYFGHTPASATEVSASLDHMRGTRCRRLCDSYGQFKRQLKTFLFRSQLATAYSDCRFLRLRDILTYLLTYVYSHTSKALRTVRFPMTCTSGHLMRSRNTAR